MAIETPYVSMATAACTVKDWHLTMDCVDSKELETKRLQNLKSDLFQPRKYDTPAPQKEIMNRNYNSSTLLRLPPEIRLHIYGFVLGGQHLWISHTGIKIEYMTQQSRTPARLGRQAQSEPAGLWFHQYGRLYHKTASQLDDDDHSPPSVHLGLLRVCRQVYVESQLLPYRLNTFMFEDQGARKAFEGGARRGGKAARKKAVGKVEVGSLEVFRERYG